MSYDENDEDSLINFYLITKFYDTNLENINFNINNNIVSF